MKKLGPIRKLETSLGVVLCFALPGCVAGNLGMETHVMQYSGDGKIRNCSNIFRPGYAIEFPKFDSDRPYEASYRLSHLPPTGREPPGIYLRFYQPRLRFGMAQRKKDAVTATFRLALCDAKGNTLHSAEVHLSRTGWSEQKGLFSIYALGKSYVHFERNASYVLNVSYTPGTVPPPASELYFAIDACAFY